MDGPATQLERIRGPDLFPIIAMPKVTLTRLPADNAIPAAARTLLIFSIAPQCAETRWSPGATYDASNSQVLYPGGFPVTIADATAASLAYSFAPAGPLNTVIDVTTN